MTAPVTEAPAWSDIPKGTDLVLRVRRLEVDGEVFADIREYVPSNDTYGRGLMVPIEVASTVAKALQNARKL